MLERLARAVKSCCYRYRTLEIDGRSIAWVSEVLKRMLTIKPGMTREALLRAFTTEGGLSLSLSLSRLDSSAPS